MAYHTLTLGSAEEPDLHHHHHEGSFSAELILHVPYALFLAAVGMIILSSYYTSLCVSLGRLTRFVMDSFEHMLERHAGE